MENKQLTQEDLKMDSFPDFFDMGHENIHICQDEKTGLKAIVAVHSTICGPALGGTRMWNYANSREALIDVMRLSRGMTYKNAISGLNLGGGKAVIIGDSSTDKSPDLFRKFGSFIDSLNGSYITAEDVGISPEDMIYVAEKTKYVTGLPGKMGDPSPVTAYGVYMGMKAAANFQYGNDNLSGKKIAVQGVGHVGEYLIEYLTKEGADLVITDINESLLKRVAEQYSCKVVNPNDIYDVDMDIYAPCALGATINDETIDKLKCSVVAGAANNQLKDETIHGNELMKRGVVYAPDYLINAGGVMNCYAEVHDISSEQVMKMAENIYATTTEILNLSREQEIPTFLASNRIAEERLKKESNK